MRGYIFDLESAGGDRLKILINGDKSEIVEARYEPYFYLIPDNMREAEKELLKHFGDKIRKIEIVEKEDKKILKIVTRSPGDVIEIRHYAKELGDSREDDINYTYRYLIDHGLYASRYYDFETENGILKKAKELPDEPLDLKVLAFDIEVYNPKQIPDADRDPIVCIGYCTAKERDVLYWTESKGSEKEMIGKFIKKVGEYDPDVIVGYNSAGFDFPYLNKRCHKLGVKLALGRDYSEVQIRKGGIYPRADIFGRAHIDAYDGVEFLTRIGAMRLPKNDLDSVYRELYGKHKVDLEGKLISDLWDAGGKSLELLIKYNQEDAVAAFEIAKEILPLHMALSKIIGLPLYETSRMATSQMIEWLLIREAHRRGILVPNRSSEAEVKERLMGPIKGAFVKLPESGLHEGIVIFDFRSLYPSIIMSYNLDKTTYNCECCKSPTIVPEVGHKFCKDKKGLIPKILEELIEARTKVKVEMKKHPEKSKEHRVLHFHQWGLKILANSAYGYLGYARARWYSREAAESVTALGRHYIHETMDEAEKVGFHVFYADSVTNERFVTLMDADGNLVVKNVEKLFEENKENVRLIGEKEICKLNGWKALTVNPKSGRPCFEKVIEIIRHRVNKQIVRVNQKFGETRVTEDHSLIIKEGSKYVEAKPRELGKKELARITAMPPLKAIKKIDLYALLRDYSHELIYKKRLKRARAHTDKKQVWFGWTIRKEPIKLKRFIKINSPEFESLCRLLGAYIAEGSTSTPETTDSRWGAVISASDINWLKQLQKDYLLLFSGCDVGIIKSSKKERHLKYLSNSGTVKKIRYFDLTYKLQMQNQLASVFFKQLCGQKSTGKKLPSFIFHVPNRYKRILMDNMVLGDGSKKYQPKYSKEYCLKNFRYTTKSLGVVSGLSALLIQLKQKYTIQYRRDKKTYTLQTSTKHNTNLTTKIFKEKYNGYVYDLSVEHSNMFTDSCGQILLHNTDSIFIKLGDKTVEEAKKFVEKINKELPAKMELEFQGYYPRGIFVSKREGTAAKKRYALIREDGVVEIKGFEFVRSDWANIAKETQEKVIEAILKEGKPEKAVDIVKKVIKDVQDRKVDVEDLIIYTQVVRKVSSYEQQAPHVKAAKKLIEAGQKIGPGSVLEYVVVKGSGSISDRSIPVQLLGKKDYDADYYINNQILPAVMKILKELGVKEEDLKFDGKQSGLGKWF